MNKDEIQHIRSIHELHELMGFPKPSHPLISLIDVSKWVIPEEYVGIRTLTDFYSIALKDKSCGMQYGRNLYDFNEGVLIFTAPQQVQSVLKAQKENEIQGWMLFFHPDLIRNTPLGNVMQSYHFFSYDVHEALHLSEVEQKTITDCVQLIQQECEERIDKHSQLVISSTLQLLLNYSQRFYERQFNTRSAENTDAVSQFQAHLSRYHAQGLLREKGLPSLDFFSEKMHLSSNYLSDLLKRETGQSAKEHIHDFLIDKAKTLLLSQSDSVGEIAFSLGFSYPHYFSRLFKSKTGYTPLEYRSLN